jgi:hypothetical protein
LAAKYACCEKIFAYINKHLAEFFSSILVLHVLFIRRFHKKVKAFVENNEALNSMTYIGNMPSNSLLYSKHNGYTGVDE